MAKKLSTLSEHLLDIQETVMLLKDEVHNRPELQDTVKRLERQLNETQQTLHDIIEAREALTQSICGASVSN